MKCKDNKGFTMAEMLIVVGIVVVLAAVSFTGIISYQRTLKRLEYDGIAREIFMAAQNHLTMADSQGLVKTRSVDGINVTETKTDGGTSVTIDDIYYFCVPDSKLDDEDSVLNLMLPQYSVDETVRGGSYLIRYQKSSATVLDVFYSPRDNQQFGFDYKEANYDELMEVRGEENRSARQNYQGTGAILGYYGGEEGRKVPLTFVEPSILVENSDRLKVTVVDPNTKDPTDLDPAAVDPHGYVTLLLIVKGKTSGAEQKIPISQLTSGEYGYDVTKTTDNYNNDNKYTYELIFDDITAPGLHFAEQFDDFIPGEDIEIQAKLFSVTHLSNITWSAKVTTNSLFADPYSNNTEIRVLGSSIKDGLVAISSFRHLENLDPKVSNLDVNSEPNEFKITKATQITNLIWKDSDEATMDFVSEIKIDESDEDPAIFLFGNKNETADTLSGYYYPVNPNYALTYDGQNHTITGVAVDIADNAGLFGTLVSDSSSSKISSVKDLELIDFNIKSTKEEGGNAGALAGTADAAITNVVVRNSVSNGSDNAAYEISGTGSAGGLIGSMTGGSVTDCVAAVYVQSTGGDAGGLIGTTNGVTVSSSYSGGHTYNGMYLAPENDGTYLSPVDGSTVLTAPVQGRVNVIGNANAGGLIGSMNSGTTVTNCYSTCSVKGATAGGFAGSAGGTINNSYCTGLVLGAGTPVTGSTLVKAFVGSGTPTTSAGNPNYYYSIINSNYYGDWKQKLTEKKDAAAETAVEELAAGWDNTYAFDAAKLTVSGTSVTVDKTAVEMYNMFCPATLAAAEPYDEQLGTLYNDKYPFKTVEQLNNKAATKAHYGDWPAPEILVFNTASNS